MIEQAKVIIAIGIMLIGLFIPVAYIITHDFPPEKPAPQKSAIDCSRQENKQLCFAMGLLSK